MIKEVPKLVSKAIFAVIFTKIFGPLGIPVGWMLSEYLTETLGEPAQKFFEKFGEEAGLLTAQSITGVFGFLEGNADTTDKSASDFSLVCLLAKSWEVRLNHLINNRDFDNEDFKKQTILLKKWRDKFKEAQDEKNLLVIYEIFPKETSADFGIQQKAFETITNQTDAENNLWTNLKKILEKWTDEDEKEIFKLLENDVRKTLTEDLQDEILAHLRDNQDFRDSFNTIFEFFVTEQLKKQGKTGENTNKIVNRMSKKLNGVFKLLENLKSLPKLSKELAYGKFPEDIRHFTNQTEVLENLHTTLIKEKIVSLSGTHGLGKTSIAIRYSYQFKKCFKHIIFINANKNKFVYELSKIANDVKPFLSKDIKDEYKAFEFGSWLKEKDKCLVIFDNIENFEQNSKYIPQYDNGFIIITSNESGIDRKWTPIKLAKWKTKDLELLLFRLTQNIPKAEYKDIPVNEKDIIKEIVKELDELPLALNIAASYISTSKISFRQYLEEFKEFRGSFFDEAVYDNEGIPKSVRSTFLISIKRISEFNQTKDTIELVPQLATICLKISAFLSSVDIPEDIFKKCVSNLQSRQNAKIKNVNIWRKVSNKLLAFSLFEKNLNSETFSTFPSIQKILRIHYREEQKNCMELIIDVFEELFIAPTEENKETCRKYSVHLKSALDFFYSEDFEDEEFSITYLQKISSLNYKLEQFENLVKEEQLTNVSTQL